MASTNVIQKTDSLGRKRSPGQDKGRAGTPAVGDGALTLRVPSYLDAHGKRAWNQAAKALRRKSILDTADGRLLELFASSYSLYRRAESLIKKKGLLLTTPGTYGVDKLVENPAIKIRSRAWRECCDLFGSLGIGPISRRKLQIADSDDESEDAFMDMLKKRNERRARAMGGK